MQDVYGLIVGFAFGVIATAAWKRSLFTSAGEQISAVVKDFKRQNYKMVLVVRNDLGMSKGKIASQCSHAAVGCYRIAQKNIPDVVKSWERHGQPKIVLKLDTPGEDGLYKLMNEAKKRGIVSTVIRDAGRTEIAEGTATVTGLGPCGETALNEITGHLKLL